MKKLFLAALVLASTGCTTINFENGNVQDKEFTTSKWHHNVAIALVEVSEPVNLEKECQGKEWNKVQTQLSFINGLAGAVVNMVGPIWYPKTVSVNCK